VDSAGVVIVGAGAAGLALARHLGVAGRDDVVIVEAPPGPHTSPERTWCSWQSGSPWWAPAVSATWHRVGVVSPDGREGEYVLDPLRYTRVRSQDYARFAGDVLAGTPVRRRTATVTTVHDDGTVEGADVSGRYVFDTRPAAPSAAGRVALLQHFRGWFVRTDEDRFHPGLATLMDFRPAQPPGGVAFGYVLPTSTRDALVEYTEFSRGVLSLPQYEAALTAYCRDTLRLGAFRVVGAEQGVIPMTDAPFARRVGERVFRLGAAGGATRPSTGYTFSAAQRQARAVADALLAGSDPTPPPAYGARQLWMDRVLLRAVDDQRLDGAAFFARLFRDQPTERVLRFLDGATSLREDVAVMAASPLAPMVRTVLAR